MNEEEFQYKIKTLIKTKKLPEYLLDCLINECKRDSLNSLPFIIKKASQRFETKIELCKQVEEDFPDRLILSSEYTLLSGKA